MALTDLFADPYAADSQPTDFNMVENAAGTSVSSDTGGGFLSGASTFLTAAGSFLTPIVNAVKGTSSPTATVTATPGSLPGRSTGVLGGISTTTLLIGGFVAAAIIIILVKSGEKKKK